MNKKIIKIGIVGFSQNQFDKKEAQLILEKILVNLKQTHQNKTIEIVSGYTNSGVPKIAYEIADRLDLITVGYSAHQALKVKSGVYPVKKAILKGEKFGEESVDFVNYIDGLVRVGGGKQSRHEVALFKKLHTGKPISRMLKEFEIDWYGKPPETQVTAIKGLHYIENFISQDDHENLVRQIDEEPWSNELKRRVQHYGYKYDYRSRNINKDMKAAVFPKWAMEIGQQLVAENLMPVMPDQMIINEYLPGQGIADHIDCQPCFGNTIVSISLLSAVAMNFKNPRSKASTSVVLKPGSAIQLSAEARYNWMHGIPARKTDMIAGVKTLRSRRISLTFRTVILS